MFAAYIKTGSTTIETHYRSKKNQTIVMMEPIELGNEENDYDGDSRATRSIMSGMVIPWVVTDQGEIEIHY